MLQINNYKKYYDSQLIVDIPALVLYRGIYCLKGENGSGKTTLMKSIAGLIPFDGNISVTGTDIKHHRTKYRDKVNYAEAEPLYPSFLTGNDLVKFYSEAKKARPEQITELIASFGIKSYIGNKIGTYSSGMAKKLSLLLGFIGSPELILLDEPLITLDTASQRAVQDLIAAYHHAGTSFLITSHQELLNGLLEKTGHKPDATDKQPLTYPFQKLTFTRLVP